MICEWLTSHKIRFKKQPFLTYQGVSHPYDFLLPDFKTLLEFDGNHHWNVSWFSVNKTMTEEEYRLANEAAIEKQQKEDAHELRRRPVRLSDHPRVRADLAWRFVARVAGGSGQDGRLRGTAPGNRDRKTKLAN